MADGPILNYFYGDDFTGTMATAEIFTTEGLPAIVFPEAPAPSFLAGSFPKARVVGIAGSARTLATERLSSELLPVMRAMREQEALTYLYKVCSTFDSSPGTGNIGRAIEIGAQVFEADYVAVHPSAPAFGRYVLFGNMFAALGGKSIYRLDRHPSMSTHPVTPMTESDLLLHLGKQTDLPGGLVNILSVEAGIGEVKQEIQKLTELGVRIVLFDCLHERHHGVICEAVYQTASHPPFMVGSHEAAFGLGALFRSLGQSQPQAPGSPAKEVGEHEDRGPILVVSGSCAVMSGRQILWARKNGFTELALDPQQLLDPETAGIEIERAVQTALGALSHGRSVVVHTAIGPRDERIEKVRARAMEKGLSAEEIGANIGSGLGNLTQAVVRESGVKRIVITGGDTAGSVQKHLHVEALQIAASLGDPAPICFVYSRMPGINGREIAFKGGQVGREDYYGTARNARTRDFAEAALGSLAL